MKVTKTATTFKLRPHSAEELITASRGNKSFAVREWLKAYIANPTPLTVVEDRLVSVTVAIEPDFLKEIHAAAAANNMSTMQFVRLIVEKNLHDK